MIKYKDHRKMPYEAICGKCGSKMFMDSRGWHCPNKEKGMKKG